MNTLSFEWAGLTPLVLELSKPLKQISVDEFHGRPVSVTLWRQDGTGLRLSSQMHDVAERAEVGVLRFEYASLPKDGETVVAIASAFNGHITVFKLVIHESGTSAESGIVLKASDGGEIVVVPNVYPYFLALAGGASAVRFRPGVSSGSIQPYSLHELKRRPSKLQRRKARNNGSPARHRGTPRVLRCKCWVS